MKKKIKVIATDKADLSFLNAATKAAIFPILVKWLGFLVAIRMLTKKGSSKDKKSWM